MRTVNVEPRLLNTAQAAEYTGLAKQTLHQKRISGGGPKFCKIGRSVRYRKEDLNDWIESFRTVSSIAELYSSENSDSPQRLQINIIRSAALLPFSLAKKRIRPLRSLGSPSQSSLSLKTLSQIPIAKIGKGYYMESLHKRCTERKVSNQNDN